MIKWSDVKTDAIYRIDGRVGKYKWFTITRDNLYSTTENRYKLLCFLPGLKHFLGSFSTEDAAKGFATAVCKRWLDNSILQTKEIE